MRTRLLILGLGLLALGLWSPSLDAQEKPGAPTCDVRLDLQYELPRGARVTLAGQMEVAPPVVQLIMSKAGDMHWDEVTKHGKKYPAICRDDEHPYYVLVWASDSTTVGEATVYSATADLHVLDNGCLVYPSVFGLYWINTSREKAIKKVFEAALRFLVENGDMPAPSPLTCEPPQMLGPLGPTKYKLKALRDICKEHRPTYTEACRSFTENAAASPEASLPPAEPASNEGKVTVGTGFFVSEHGYILTNAHVVSACRQIQTRDGRQAALVSKDEQFDFALLKIEGDSPAVATFRLRPAPRVGDSVVAFGFPLQGILSSGGNLTTGNVSATAGIGDDTRFIQITTPVQPGNSGSPLLDSSGDVVGVVEAKLDALETLRIAGDIPQNVNFAIRASEAIKFLERNNVAYHADTTDSILDLKVADIAAKAKRFSVPIQCVE